MSDIEVVRGASCLNYVDRAIGLIGCDRFNRPNSTVASADKYSVNSMGMLVSHTNNAELYGMFHCGCNITKIKHNSAKRKIGLVLNRYEDDGLHVAILGDNEYIDVQGGDTSQYSQDFSCGFKQKYERENPLSIKYVKTPGYNGYPLTDTETVGNGCYAVLFKAPSTMVGFDDMLDYTPNIQTTTSTSRPLIEWNYQRFSDDINSTIHFGRGMVSTIALNGNFRNPLNFISGDLYFAGSDVDSQMHGVCAPSYDNIDALEFVDINIADSIDSFNQCARPYNLILTESETYARAYLDHGTIPPDAFLYPLDWEHLPGYNESPDDEPDDEPDNNTPGDNSRDITPNLPVVPSFTPSMLSNYNWYWLSVPQYSDFIQWFWNDIGNYNDFDDLIAKVKGLYNDVASAVLMCRFFPVDISWIGGTGTQSNIKVGMIEKNGGVDTINQSSPPAVREIGHYHFSKKYKSFLDLPPYTQISLYLPFHGFVDLDVDILIGHDLYVKGIYDYLTGTLQYLLYYDNQFLINSYIVKLAVDIPITLQTKNDRDSATFNNVASTVSGLIGAGAGIASGNPIGIALGVTQGVTAMNSANASAPMKVVGTVGESGALYSPPQCAIIIRRPTIQSSDKGNSLNTWKSRVGQLCGYGYTLSGLSGKGLTVCQDPRITFTKTVPLQSEIDEIYDHLVKGVIL